MQTRLATLLSLPVLILGLQSSARADVFFSEYIEGSSNNKALEIFNGTGAAVDLSTYEVQMYFNGSTSPGVTIALSGTVANGDVFVVANGSANSTILAAADQTDGSGWYNGDDAVVLARGGAIVDVIGQIGTDPGSSWSAGGISTQNSTLRRKTSVAAGDTSGSDVFDPSLEWDAFPQDDASDLGVHAGGGGGGGGTPGQVRINETDADTSGSDTLEFVELYDGGAGNTDLTGFVLVFYNGNGDASYRSIDLGGYFTDANGYFVAGNTGVSTADFTFGNGTLQNGPDAVALYEGSGSDFPNGTPVTTTNLVDAIVYDTGDADDAGLLVLLNAGEPQVDEAGAGDKDNHSLQRCANGEGGLRNTSSYIAASPSPKSANVCPGDGGGGGGGGGGGVCGDAATFIHDVQGSGISSPLSGQVHSIEGVVVGDFQDTTVELSGFFVQEEDTDVDADAATSEGIFVYDPNFLADVVLGDVVRVTGTVAEFDGQTQLTTVTDVQLCAGGGTASAASVSLPFSEAGFPERFESMAVSFSQTLTVTENYNLGRYGTVILSSGGRLQTPTNVVSPGADAAALQAANDLNRISLDDANTAQNPDPIIHPAPGLSASNTLRSGDTVTGLAGVLGGRFGEYQIHATQTPSFVHDNARTSAPALPGTGNLRVASFNVLNYFNGDGNGGGFPTARGADTASELQRQQDKIVSAILAMGADVVGLMEIENDGYGSTSAIQTLVDALNAAGGDYAIIDPGLSALGGDAIAVGFIYRPSAVTPVGLAQTLDSYPFDFRNRQPLLQTFDAAGGGRFSVVVNHFKSKGSCPSSGVDSDQGDGQGCWNAVRTEAANALSSWLAGDPTSSGDPDFMVIGDLNAYAKEDPITALEANGYTNLVSSFGGPDAYSYIFRGQAGYLDHALATAGLAAQVTGTVEWHINADEPRTLDYNEEFKSAGQITSLYSPDAYRASDHDPVVIELSLSKSPNSGEPGGGRLLASWRWIMKSAMARLRAIWSWWL